ncbi:hypothetical protein BC941DRAFT_454410 [Chlamydoabsidia padenii]|nr:hypothetical protein BC941DRAFT_454410 [Chlamydoabsidia padenii]
MKSEKLLQLECLQEATVAGENQSSLPTQDTSTNKQTISTSSPESESDELVPGAMCLAVKITHHQTPSYPQHRKQSIDSSSSRVLTDGLSSMVLTEGSKQETSLWCRDEGAYAWQMPSFTRKQSSISNKGGLKLQNGSAASPPECVPTGRRS